jgi:hypothetical protein
LAVTTLPTSHAGHVLEGVLKLRDLLALAPKVLLAIALQLLLLLLKQAGPDLSEPQERYTGVQATPDQIARRQSMYLPRRLTTAS